MPRILTIPFVLQPYADPRWLASIVHHAIKNYVAVVVLVGIASTGFAQTDIQFPPTSPDREKQPTGTLAIQALQGTPNGPTIGITDVVVRLFHQEKLIKTVTTQLDEFGIIVIDSIPLTTSVTPVVEISYLGAIYLEAGATMDSTHPQQTIKITCYEITDNPPVWTIPIRQIMLSNSPLGTKVSETLIVMNPSKTTWLGEKGPLGKLTTLAIALPHNATHITLDSGFHDWCCTSVIDDTLFNHLPLKPHITELNFNYMLAATSGTTSLNFIAASDTDRVVVMVPNEMLVEQFSGLEMSGTTTIADTQISYYTANKLEKGDEVSFSILGTMNKLPNTESTTTPVFGMSKIVAGVCAVIFLIAGAVVVYRQKT